MADLGPYEGFSLGKSGLPEPTAVLGWWRRRWLFEATDGPLQSILVPPPVGGIDPFSAVVTSSCTSEGKIIVDCYTRDEVISGDALTYVSLVAAWINHRRGGREIVVNGERGHVILRMSRLNEQLIADLENMGY